MGKITAIHHIQITIPTGEEAAGRAFYCDLLGLEEIEKPGSLKARGGFWVQVGTLQVHVGVENGIDRSLTRVHIAYEVDDLTYWESRLRESGFEVELPPAMPQFTRLHTRDPFGNKIELLQASD